MRLLLCVCLMFGMATPAKAEWQGFSWGMSESQVEAAESQVAVVRFDVAKHRRTYPSYSTLGGLWVDDGHEYQLSFYFDSEGKLRDIDIDPASVECSQQNDFYAERFGEYEEDVSQLGPARRAVRRWQLGDEAELMSMVLHFPNTDSWTCGSTIKKPVTR
jgi:hypothetical protein